jgi:hypothetical protein
MDDVGTHNGHVGKDPEDERLGSTMVRPFEPTKEGEAVPLKGRNLELQLHSHVVSIAHVS